MEKVIFKYSDFYEDDGGFDKIRADLKNLGDDMVSEAQKIKKDFAKAFDLDDLDGISKTESKVEDLSKAFKKYGDAKENINKIEEEFRKTMDKSNQTSDDQLDRLAKLDKKLQEYRTDLKELNKLGTKNGKVVDDVNKSRVEAQLAIKKISAEIRDQQKEVLKSNELSRKEQKLIEARLVLQKEEIRNRDDLRERIKALRIVVDSLDFETQADQIAKYNAEIDELTETLSENSDKFIQSKINIGNYEESIVNALKGTNLFQGELSVLNGIIDQGIDLLFKSKVANEAEATAKKKNTKATVALGKSVKVLNKIAKASVILLLVAAVASLASVFSQGRAGVIATDKAMARFNVTVKVIINTIAEVGKGLFKLFQGIGTSIGNFSDKIELFFVKIQRTINSLPSALGGSAEKVKELDNEIAVLEERISNQETSDKYAEGWKQISDAVSGAGKRIEDAKKAIDTLDEGAIRAFEIADEIRKAELNLISLRREVRLLEIQSEDSTRSLKTQLEATDELLVKRVELLERESDIALKNLELANAKARADAESAGFRLSQDDVNFAKELLDLNIRLSERNGENPLDDSLLEGTQQALRDYLATLDEVKIAEAEIGKQRREISRDLFEQNLDLLIDLIDTEKNLSEQFVNDVSKNFQSRINEFNRFLIVFRQNAQKQLDEFTKEANNLGLDLDFSIEYDENGDFKVFVGDTELAIDNIVELNDQLQNTGLNEIDINRFREFITEARNGLRDFKDLNKELQLAKININELRENVVVSQEELNSLDQLQQKIEALQGVVNGGSPEAQKLALKQIKALEDERTRIQELAERNRLENRLDSIDAELELVEFESQRYYELLQERLDIEKQLREKSIQDGLDKTKEANKKALEDYKKFGDEVRQILDAILDKAVEVQQKRVQEAEKRVETQEELIDTQRQRAEQGLTNTLAFEQRELGKREAERIKQEQRQQRLEKIRALYSSYNNYASRGDENAIVKALRDFAILESITASFGDGGVVEDKLPGNGIFRGQSHNGNKGGIPIRVEGKEGIFSVREMENLGKDNFYKMKDLASMGKIDSNFFSKQRESFVAGVPIVQGNETLVKEMRDVKRAIENKPSESWDVTKVADGTMELVQTIMTKNHKKRNHFKTKKPRI